ncbi:hypothetical protein SynMVIR181_01584 [Synechococcus sp. MVIR-18-1]|nr:hypothetical protein SynMVIR181_01584 [Synechococcus sp. MVIR-18-1]
MVWNFIDVRKRTSMLKFLNDCWIIGRPFCSVCTYALLFI